MNLFDVYPLNDVTIVKAKDSYVWDENGVQYLDMYGGHAVISIGHTHPHWVKRIEKQLNKIAFYSNSVKIPIQRELATKLGKISGKEDYQLFLCNSGAEANENALKLASFVTGKKKVIAFKKAFHGRTSGAVARYQRCDDRAFGLQHGAPDSCRTEPTAQARDARAHNSLRRSASNVSLG